MRTATADAIMEALRKLAPNVAFWIHREHDPDAKWDVDDPSLDPDDFECWEFDVSAKCVIGGKLIVGMASLGNSWAKYGVPFDRDLGGYLPQMLQDAQYDLDSLINDERIQIQLNEVEEYLRDLMKREYDACMAGRGHKSRAAK